MRPVPDDVFRAYLRTGGAWPQLRAPLAAAVVTRWRRCAGFVPPDILGSQLDESQLQVGATLANRLHDRFGIASVINRETFQLEWEKSVAAAHSLYRTAVEEPSRVRLDDRPAEVVTAVLGIVDQVTRSETFLAEVFRTSFCSSDVREAWARRLARRRRERVVVEEMDLGLVDRLVCSPCDARAASLRELTGRIHGALERESDLTLSGPVADQLAALFPYDRAEPTLVVDR